jgi:hypothetical protein
VVEAQDPAACVTRAHGQIDIDSAKGITLWYSRALHGPTMISFDAMAVRDGGANDQVSDLNAFWMASERDGSSPSATVRGGSRIMTRCPCIMWDWRQRNTTTRQRRYVGQVGVRPLLPQHDRADSLLVPNVWTHITLIADGAHIAVPRDGQSLFTMDDAAPYTHGWFALRTTWSHLRIRHLSIRPLRRKPPMSMSRRDTLKLSALAALPRVAWPHGPMLPGGRARCAPLAGRAPAMDLG